MNWKDKKSVIIEKYQDQFIRYGVNNQSLFTPGRKQNVRFNVIKEIGLSSTDSILDVGCGFGDPLKYLKRVIDYKGKYTGIDITPEFVSACLSLNPDIDFRLLDILQEEIHEQWDFVVLTGTLNINIGEIHTEFVRQMITKMFNLSKKGVSIDFVSTYGDNRNENIYRADPCEIFSFCKSLSRRVSLRNDYLPWEFAIYIFKDDSITEDNIFSKYEYQKVIDY